MHPHLSILLWLVGLGAELEGEEGVAGVDLSLHRCDRLRRRLNVKRGIATRGTKAIWLHRSTLKHVANHGQDIS